MKDYSKNKMGFYAIFERVGVKAEEVDETQEIDPVDPNFMDGREMLTLVVNEKQMNEFIVRYTVRKNFEHFKMWAPLHGFKDENDDGAAQTYFNECFDQLEKPALDVVPWMMRGKDVAVFLRMFFDCNPIGCDYEGAEEKDYEKQKNDSVAQVCEDAIDKMTEAELQKLIDAAKAKFAK